MPINPDEKLTEHFSRAEIACKCGCGVSNFHLETLERLEAFRAHLGKNIFITSGCRCAKHNKAIGGSSGSYHLAGDVLEARAVDIRVFGSSALNLMVALESWDAEGFFTGRGIYLRERFCHIDSGHAQLTMWLRKNGIYFYLNNF